MNPAKKREKQDGISTALAAVALQDHLVRSLKLGRQFESKERSVRDAALRQHRTVQVRTGSKIQNDNGVEHEYVLDRKPAPLTLAQRLGLVEAPPNQLTEAEWTGVKDKAKQRHDFQQPCVICKDDLGLKAHVLLSCTHVFHKSCLQAFERFTSKKTCPMCRKEQYQTRVVHDGKFFYKDKSATVIQSAWRGYVARTMYKKLREIIPPRDIQRRKLFYEEKLKSITDRMVRSLDCDVASFCSQMDRDLERSRNVFRQFDDTVRGISEDEWKEIIAKAVQRDISDCSICLTALNGALSSMPEAASSRNYSQQPVHKMIPAKDKTPNFNSNGSKNSRSAITKQCSTHSSSATKYKNTNRSPSIRVDAQSATNKYKTVIQLSCSFSDDQIKDEVNKGIIDRDVVVHKKAVVILSCSHAFHQTCLEALEEFALTSARFVCPICRAFYQKRSLDWNAVVCSAMLPIV